ncbi:invasion associated locus B family protein [Oceaniglobus trochenteri]|uniref:invasion associated locus B family protein n=1 Tax=Oceaniglobus trochenteri TaxID=2763260 RepID=UPI001CFFF5C7|nr:invasion associated locus B family protein [Oceaniglobus trochenteri]
MSDLLKTLGIVAMVAWAPMAMAQSTETPADDSATAQEEAPAADGVTDNGLALGEEVGANGEGGVGSTYISAEHGDWEVRCVRAAEGDDPCQLYQLLSDDQGNAVAEISIFGLPKGQQAAAGATVITPLETLLTAQMTLAVDGGKAKRYPYTFCAANGCFARIGFTSADVAGFKAGAAATLTIVPAAAPDEKVALKVSLSGFTAGYDAVNEANGN